MDLPVFFGFLRALFAFGVTVHAASAASAYSCSSPLISSLPQSSFQSSSQSSYSFGAQQAKINRREGVKKEGISSGWKIKIKDPKDPDTTMMTANVYKNGTILIQGNIKQFEIDFLCIKERAQHEKATSNDISQTQPHNTCSQTTEQPPEEKEPTSSEQPQDPQLNLAITNLMVKFTELEREVVHQRELISLWQPTTPQPDLCTELDTLRKDRDNCWREMTLLRTQIQDLQQDREHHLTALTTLTEEVKKLQGERKEYKRALTSLSKEVEELQREKEEHRRALTPSSQQPQASPEQQTISIPSSSPSSQTSSTSQNTQTSIRPAQQRENSDIVLLIDSNGKFLDENKLFPSHKVSKIWCPNTHKALELLSEERLGSPSHIIIHTGTNDLQSQQERVSDSLNRVIEKASTTFPTSRVIMSTLAPKERLPPRHHPQDQPPAYPETVHGDPMSTSPTTPH
ncbi:hypothetical protein WMY93_025258 [Mugilogobius chulae]|uniref:Uncharacterized protein n=1 Tax=Mugilogobius chulae TaxID=88201 RepID=A0AAW0N3M9_9GOBI